MMTSTPKPSVNIHAKNALAKLMATENIYVQHAQVDTASFDVKNRVLRLPMWENMTNSIYEGLIGHEVGHALYTPNDGWVNFVKKFPKLKDYINILEDARIEKKMKTKYPGMRKTFWEMYAELSDRDFFGIGDRDLDSFGFADRINMHFKMGVQSNIAFSNEEKSFIDKIAIAETWEDIEVLTHELAGMARDEENELRDFDQVIREEDLEDFLDELDLNESSASAPEIEQDSSGDEEPDEEGESQSGDTGEEGEESEEKKEGANQGENTPRDSAPEGDVPETETVGTFENALKTLNNPKADDLMYADLPTVDPEKATIPFKEVQAELTEHYANIDNYISPYYTQPPAGFNREAIVSRYKTEIASWKKDANKIVNYMVKEFEMKQAATAFRRTSISKTGVLNTNKMHAYKFDDDLFKRVATVKDGKNHALIMYIDWSGSMSGKMHATTKQLLTLVMFARKVGIPFRVYGFSNYSKATSWDEKSQRCTYGAEGHKLYSRDSGANRSRTHLVPEKVSLMEFFHDKMTTVQFNNQLTNLLKLSRSLDWSRDIEVPDRYRMSSTPLNEAILASYKMTIDLRKETGREKINVIFLTDGGADGNSTFWDAEKEMEIQRPCGTHLNNWRSTKVIYRDPISRMVINPDGSDSGTAKLTELLLEGLHKTTGVNVIGFHITSKKSIARSIEYSLGWDKAAIAKKTLTRYGYIGLQKGGYNTYFLISDRDLDRDNDLPDVERKETGAVNKTKLRTAFKKFAKAKTVNKMMLNEFVALVA